MDSGRADWQAVAHAETLLGLGVAAQVEELLGVGERPPVRPSAVHGAHPDKLQG